MWRFPLVCSVLVVGAGGELHAQVKRVLHGKQACSMVFSPDGTVLAVGAVDNSITLWDWGKGMPQHVLQGHSNGPTVLAYSGDGKVLVSASTKRENDQFFSIVKHWDVAAGRELKSQDLKGGGANWALSSDGKVLVTVAGWPNPVANAWDLATEEVKKLEGHTGDVYYAAISPDNKTIVTAGGAATLKLWDWPTGKERWTSKQLAPAKLVLFSGDGKLLVSQADRGRPIALWDAGTGKERGAFPTRGGSLVALSPDGKLAAVATVSKGLHLWSLDKGELLQTLTAPFPRGWVDKAVFSRDGRLLAGANADGVVCIWDLPGR